MWKGGTRGRGGYGISRLYDTERRGGIFPEEIAILRCTSRQAGSMNVCFDTQVVGTTAVEMSRRQDLIAIAKIDGVGNPLPVTSAVPTRITVWLSNRAIESRVPDSSDSSASCIDETISLIEAKNPGANRAPCHVPRDSCENGPSCLASTWKTFSSENEAAHSHHGDIVTLQLPNYGSIQSVHRERGQRAKSTQPDLGLVQTAAI